MTKIWYFLQRFRICSSSFAEITPEVGLFGLQTVSYTHLNLKGRSFLTLKDFTPEEIEYLISLAGELKAKKKQGITGNSLKGKNIALIFEKPSTRTRCAFTIGCIDEGGHPEYLGKDDIQLGHKGSVEDTARVLGRMFDGIEFRGFSQETVEKLAKYSGVPVWNGLTDTYHPTQILADFLTMKEHFGYLKGLNFVYIGDGRNNMANSLMIGASKLGIHFTIIAPEELWPLEELVHLCKEYAKEAGSKIVISDRTDAVKGADVLYTDVWLSLIHISCKENQCGSNSYDLVRLVLYRCFCYIFRCRISDIRGEDLDDRTGTY